MKILVIDDEPLICEEFRDILEEEGHQVDTARSGKESLQLVGRKEYDLIFLDVLMPKMEGREVFEAIKKISKARVAIMSGYLPPNKEREILDLGAVACFRKPLELERVRDLVNSIKTQQSQ